MTIESDLYSVSWITGYLTFPLDITIPIQLPRITSKDLRMVFLAQRDVILPRTRCFYTAGATYKSHLSRLMIGKCMNSSGSIVEDRPYDVYVIDDDEAVLEVLVTVLTARGARVKAMTSGQDLVEMIARKPPRLVLLDIMMPVINGYAVFSSIKNLAAIHKIRVYFVSALPEQNLAWYAKTNGADGYITKPFTMADIDAVLANAGITPASR
jgi:CheY-like chemotaxis protein